MRRLWLLFLVATGCGPTEESPALEPLPPGCGDKTCSARETVLACPKDCWPSKTTIDARELAACSGGRSRIEVAEATEVSLQWVRSLEALESALSRTSEVVSDAHSVFRSLALDPSGQALSQPFVRDATTGAYRFVADDESAGSAIEMLFRYGADYTPGKRGEVIVPHLFAAESYLVGASAKVDGSSATVTFTNVGPLVELLGLGPSPPNPFTLALEDATRELEKQRVSAVFSRDVTTRGIRTSWRARLERPVGPSPALAVSVEDASAHDDARGGTLTVERTAIDLASIDVWLSILVDIPQLQVDWRVDGGSLPHRGTYRSELSKNLTPLRHVALVCP